MDQERLHVDDDGFVRAPAAACYRALTHVAAWPSWWEGTTVEPRSGKDHFGVRIGPWPRAVRLGVRAHGWRHEQGFRLEVDGDLTGEVEFWLEAGWGGTVVHHLATLRGPARHRRRYRHWARQGLWGVKDHVHARVLGGEVPVVAAGAS